MKLKRKPKDLLSQVSCKGKKICKIHKYCIAVISVLILALISTALMYPGFLKTKAFSVIFNQTDWSGLANPNKVTTSAAGEVDYASANNIDNSTAGEIKLSQTFAKWQENGNTISTATGEQSNPQITSDGSGGAIIVWEDSRNGVNTYDIYTQRIDALGNNQWTANGVVVSTAAGNKRYPKITSDGSGGAIIIWNYNSTFYVQKINANGTRLWDANGVVASSTSVMNQFPQIIPDVTIDGNGAKTYSGGAIITWNDNRNNGIYAQKIDINGNRVWDANLDPGIEDLDGMPVSIPGGAGQIDPQITFDGSGGAIITWTDNRNFHNDIYAQKIDTNGTRVWDANPDPNVTDLDGIAISTIGGSSPKDARIAYDGSGGAIIAWTDSRNGGAGDFDDIYAQRIPASGAVQWASDGVPVSTAMGGQNKPQITADSSGEAVITWKDARNSDYDIYAQKIDGNGIRQWDVGGDLNGVAVSTAANGQEDPQIVSDGSGGAIIVWPDLRSGGGNVVYAQKMDTSGAPQWTIDGVAISNRGGTPYPQITSDGSDGAIIAWRDDHAGDADIYAQKVGDLGYSALGSLTSSTVDAGSPKEWGGIEWTAAGLDNNTSISLQTRTAIHDPSTNLARRPGAIASATSSSAIGTCIGDICSPDLAFDGDMSLVEPVSFWISDIFNPANLLVNGPQSLTIDFGSPQEVRRVVVKSNPSFAPRNYTIQTWNDSTLSWDTQITEIGNASGEKESIFPSVVSTNKVMIEVSLSNGGYPAAAIGEFEIYSGVWSDWSDPIITSGSNIASPIGQYIQYKATLSTTDLLETPTLQDVTISADPVTEPEPDTTPPTNITTVNDGTGGEEDIDTTTSTTSLSANWTNSTDAESNVINYYYAIGTTLGGINVVDWTNNDTSTSVTRNDLTLSVGDTYYFSVKARNEVGLDSAVTTSDGVTVSTVLSSDLIMGSINGLSGNNLLIADGKPVFSGTYVPGRTVSIYDRQVSSVAPMIARATVGEVEEHGLSIQQDQLIPSNYYLERTGMQIGSVNYTDSDPFNDPNDPGVYAYWMEATMNTIALPATITLLEPDQPIYVYLADILIGTTHSKLTFYSQQEPEFMRSFIGMLLGYGYQITIGAYGVAFTASGDAFTPVNIIPIESVGRIEPVGHPIDYPRPPSINYVNGAYQMSVSPLEYDGEAYDSAVLPGTLGKGIMGVAYTGPEPGSSYCSFSASYLDSPINPVCSDYPDRGFDGTRNISAVVVFLDNPPDQGGPMKITYYFSASEAELQAFIDDISSSPDVPIFDYVTNIFSAPTQNNPNYTFNPGARFTIHPDIPVTVATGISYTAESFPPEGEVTDTLIASTIVRGDGGWEATYGTDENGNPIEGLNNISTLHANPFTVIAKSGSDTSETISFNLGSMGAPPPAPTYNPEEKNEAPETPAEEAAETVTPPVFQSNTLEEVQATLMPDFPADWGIDYYLGRAQWAIDHRRAIYQLYLDYLGRAPSSKEVNWQFAHEPNINNIRWFMLISPELLGKHK